MVGLLWWRQTRCAAPHGSHVLLFSCVVQVMLTMVDEVLQMSQYAMLISQMMPSDLRGQDGRNTEARQAAVGVLTVQFAVAQSQIYEGLLRDMTAQNGELSDKGFPR